MADLHTLDNGVRVYADPMPGLESAAIGVWVRAGAIDETPAQHGLAHLLEHMAFKGTKRRSARAIAEEIETVGGYLNAATSYQRTGYYARVLKDDVEMTFDLLSDILANSLFDEIELAKEKDVVIQEIGEAVDTPDDVVHENLQALSYPDHSLGRPILGTIESVNAQTPETLKQFMRSNYDGASMVVAASGAVEQGAVLDWANDYFGGISAAGDRAPQPPPIYRGGAFHEARDIEQTHIALAFPGVSARDEAAFASRVFAEALGGGMASRLFQKIREARGLAYSIYAYSEAYSDVGTIGVSAGADRAHAAEVVSLVRAEIEEMAANADQAEIDRARAMLRSNLLMGLESPAGRADAAAAQLFVFDRIMPVDEIRARLDAVTLDSVREAAARALAGDIGVSVVGPADFAAVEKAACAGRL